MKLGVNTEEVEHGQLDVGDVRVLVMGWWIDGGLPILGLQRPQQLVRGSGLEAAGSGEARGG